MDDMISPSELPQLSIRQQVVDEAGAMARYALAAGLAVPGTATTALENAADATAVSTAELTAVHATLAALIAPATPNSVLVLSRLSSPKGVLGIFGAVPLVRRLMAAAIIFLIAFIAISLSPDINTDPTAGDFRQSSGLALLLNELFLFAAAGLGAAFAALFQANRFIIRGTYDPKYEASYWIRFSLGLIAGVILSQIVPEAITSLHELARPVLALLAGFSASAVYRILQRLVDAVESLVQGDTTDLIDAATASAQAKANAALVQSRLQLATNIIQVQQELNQSNDPALVKERLDELLGSLINLPAPTVSPSGNGAAASAPDPPSSGATTATAVSTPGSLEAQ